MKFTARTFCVLSAVLLLGLIPGGCTTDFFDSGTTGEGHGPAGTLSMCISMPSVTTPPHSSDTRSLDIEDEYSIKREHFHVLLFKHNGASGTTDTQYIYKRRLTPDAANWGVGNVDAQGNYVQTFRIVLDEEAPEDNLKSMIVGNISEAEMAAYNAQLEGATLAEAEQLLRFNQTDGAAWNTHATTFTPLPLWGKTEKPFSSQVTTVSTITLLRAVARIDVGVNLKGGNGTGRYDLSAIDGRPTDLDGHTFEIESVRLYNSTSSGSIAPSAANYDPRNHLVTAPTIDAAATTYHSTEPTYTKATDANAGTNIIRRQIYLPEVKNHGVDQNENAFYIVVGGKYNGAATTYYRLDFYDRDTNKDGQFEKPNADNRYDIKRNHAYVINILRVRGPGYTTPAIAAASEPVNMEVDIQSWDTGNAMGNITTDGQYRLSLSAMQLNYHTDGTAQDLTVFTDYLLANNTEASGWRMFVDNAAHEDLLLFYDDAGALIDKAEWEAAGITRGIAHVSTTLRVGLKPYTTATDGRMERTIPLRFTAGRMTARLNLVQDVLSTATLDISPAKMEFTKTPHTEQYFTVKPSPATDVTLYACWEDVNGVAIKYNISDPANPNNTGIAIPSAFVDDADDHRRKFFASASADAPIFSLLPTKWDKAANGGTNEPTVPRTFRFTIKAEWTDGRTVSKVLEVEQSSFQLLWQLLDKQNGTPIANNTLKFAGAGGTQTPYVDATPGVKWYLSSYTETGNHTAEKWLLNWAALSSTNYTGSSNLTFNVAPNPSIAGRTLVIQAASDQEGFDRITNRITIEQAGGDLVLELQRGVGTESSNLTYDAATKSYTLDYGINIDASLKGVSVRSNTDWWWEWVAGGGTAIEPYTYHWAETHPYYTPWLVANMERTIEPTQAHATQGNSNDNSLLKNWENAFKTRTPRGYFLSTTSTTDADLKTKGIPLAGTYRTEMQFRNTHARLDEANATDRARIEAASKKLIIKRTIPSLWHASTLPFGGHDYVNLGNMTAAGANKWDEQDIEFSSNNKLTMKLTRNGAAITGATHTLTPQTTYESLRIEDVLKRYVTPADVDFTKPLTVYVLTLDGKRQVQANQPDRDYTLTRTYYTGYRMVHPTMDNCNEGATLTSGAQEILFNFTGSSFHDAQEVRVGKQAFDTDGNKIAGEVTYTEYLLNGALFQRYITYEVTLNQRKDRMYAYFVEYKPYGQTAWTGTFSDGKISAPEKGKYCFVQDASPGDGGVIYGKQMQTLPELYSGFKVLQPPYGTNGKISPFWSNSRRCALTNRRLTALTPDGEYYSGGNDYRGKMYLNAYKAIYSAGSNPAIIQDIRYRTLYRCSGFLSNGGGKHTAELTRHVWGGSDVANLNPPGGWDCVRLGHDKLGFLGEIEFWYVDQNGTSGKTMNVMYLASPFGAKASTPPVMSPDLYGTKR